MPTIDKDYLRELRERSRQELQENAVIFARSEQVLKDLDETMAKTRKNTEEIIELVSGNWLSRLLRGRP